MEECTHSGFISFQGIYISVCHGCKCRYHKLGPPHNIICLQYEEWHTFTPPGSFTAQSQFGNVLIGVETGSICSEMGLEFEVIGSLEVENNLLSRSQYADLLDCGPVM